LREGPKNPVFGAPVRERIRARQQNAHFLKALCKSYSTSLSTLETTHPVSRYPLLSDWASRAPRVGEQHKGALEEAQGWAARPQPLWQVITCIGGLFGPVTDTHLFGCTLEIPSRVNFASMSRGLSPRTYQKSNPRISRSESGGVMHMAGKPLKSTCSQTPQTPCLGAF
jgi:hypothetical protein